MKSKHTTKRGARKGADGRDVVMTTEQVNAAIARGEGRTDWARLHAMTEDEIEANALTDPDNPPISNEMLATAKLIMPPEGTKAAISLRVDQDVLEYFKQTGKGYQGRMNAVLRAWMHTHPHGR